MTFTDGFLTVVPGYLLILPAIPLGLWIVRRGTDPTWTLMALLALAHVTAVLAICIFPIPIAGQEFYRQTRGMSGDNIVPFSTIVSQIQNPSLNNLRQLLGNVVALVPLGIYGPALWPALRKWRRFVVVAIAFGCGIEVTQYIGSTIEGFSYRITDVDDAIMNATGAVATFVAWPYVLRWLVATPWWPGRAARAAWRLATEWAGAGA
jgi:glycopeptide antibiotics resistance protein